jgi:ATP-dependent protease HslVU (ClpYQ) peptidase subunit
MTCIIGINDGKKTWIGGDSASSDTHTIHSVHTEKVFKKGKFIIGISGAWEASNVMRYRFNPSPIKKGVSVDKYMHTIVFDHIRRIFKHAGHLTISSSNESQNGTILIGIGKHLYLLQSGLSLVDYSNNFEATGSGGAVALGAMAATKELLPEERIMNALEIAAKYTTCVRGPMKVLST